jgi:hypothetical protein
LAAAEEPPDALADEVFPLLFTVAVEEELQAATARAAAATAQLPATMRPRRPGDARRARLIMVRPPSVVTLCLPGPVKIGWPRPAITRHGWSSRGRADLNR